MVEQILSDLLVADKKFSFAALRYFNASGCAFDGSIGEDHDPETHLIPVTFQVVMGQASCFEAVWDGLSDPGRHQHPRLYPCGRPR
jgi:UDP-glucose 4-epimerase